MREEPKHRKLTAAQRKAIKERLNRDRRLSLAPELVRRERDPGRGAPPDLTIVSVDATLGAAEPSPTEREATMPRSRTAPVTYTPEVQAVEPPKMAREGKSKTNPAVVKALAEGEWNGYKGLGFAGPDKNSASNEAARYKRAVEAEPGYGPKSLKSRVWKQDDGKWTFALTLRKPATPATEPAA